MHPRIQTVLDHLDEHRAALVKAVDDVPPSLRTQRPGVDQWSVAEVLEHLVIVETGIARLLEKKVEEARVAGLAAEGDSSPLVSSLNFEKLVDRKERLSASAAALPPGIHAPDASWAALSAKREELKAFIRRVDGLALGDVQIPHPRFGLLNVYEWLMFLAGHEGRHARQIEDAIGHLTAD